jgi:glycosyltransferase involved in cell wall biosynthesis
MPSDHPTCVLHVFSTFAVGGAQMRTTAIINRFGRGYRHMIVAMDGDYACRGRLADGLDISFPEVAIRKGDTLANIRSFRHALRQMRPDVLVTYNWGSIEWAMANLLPLVRHIHIEEGFGPEERSVQLPRRVWTRRLVLRRSTVVVPSRVLLAIATDIWRLPRNRVRYIPNGIDLACFGAAGEPEAALRWPGKGPVIGTVAGLRAEKNPARLVRAFALMRQSMPARLVIVGDGPERPALERLADELGIAADVHFTGYLTDPQSAYPTFDLFALSSDTEQMPLSVLEAMAAGLAVASTDVGDVGNMLAEDNAAFVVPKDDLALGDAMAALARDPALRRRIGAANRAKAEREFDQEAMFQTYAALLDGTSA